MRPRQDQMPSQVLGASRTGGKAFCDGMGYHTGTFPHTGLRHERHYRMPHGDGRRNRRRTLGRVSGHSDEQGARRVPHHPPCDAERADSRRPHRDQGLRLLCTSLPSGRHAPQSALGREGLRPRTLGRDLQGRQGPARGDRRAHGTKGLIAS